jgi:SNF2 family DNA or RNA helicase
LRVSRFDAYRLLALEDTLRWQFHGAESILALSRRLLAGPGVVDVPLPQGLNGTLRGYQRTGFNWLQFLREANLGGILADDMGLGKTIQTLAHILAEKEAGRLDKPALVIVPKTLVSNWREEAATFAPDLKVLTLDGPLRRLSFNEIGESDLIVSTYALISRDEEALCQYEYHLLILDEAQYARNPKTKAAGTARRISAEHRLCLTGTPIENHLMDLWAQFDFLMPGFLDSQEAFTKAFRTPIEHGDGDPLRSELLRNRVRPFILRRKKEEVEKELPEKVHIVRSVEIEGGQRDLYETVRATQDEKVRSTIAEMGIAQSSIIILAAILKLREVCCDPRLVNLSAAADVKESAKLKLLIEMVTQLIAEGRKILIFSFFPRMLALIAGELDRIKLGYVELTGDTRDRDTPIKRFQNGEVPLFLISLKTGGVGLNLTAADVVIHYDPWWNPSSENQATDRAHRIGSKAKTLFVYKLLVAGSIEERIVALQQKKAKLADSIVGHDSAGGVKFTQADINALLAPLRKPDM